MEYHNLLFHKILLIKGLFQNKFNTKYGIIKHKTKLKAEECCYRDLEKIKLDIESSITKITSSDTE